MPTPPLVAAIRLPYLFQSTRLNLKGTHGYRPPLTAIMRPPRIFQLLDRIKKRYSWLGSRVSNRRSYRVHLLLHGSRQLKREYFKRVARRKKDTLVSSPPPPPVAASTLHHLTQIFGRIKRRYSRVRPEGSTIEAIVSV